MNPIVLPLRGRRAFGEQRVLVAGGGREAVVVVVVGGVVGVVVAVDERRLERQQLHGLGAARRGHGAGMCRRRPLAAH